MRRTRIELGALDLGAMDRKFILTMLTMIVSLVVSMAVMMDARPTPLLSIVDSEGASAAQSTGRKLLKLVRNQLVLPYHNGPLLTRRSSSLNIYIIWYGDFSPAQKSAIVDFLDSFKQTPEEVLHPSVSSWWKMTAGYNDASAQDDAVVPFSSPLLAGQRSVAYTLGKSLKTPDIEALVVESLATSSSTSAFPADSNAIYFVLTAHDVFVQNFCMSSCASHDFFTSPPATPPPVHNSPTMRLPYAWVGNSADQCPGLCAWPFALPQFGPLGAKPLIPPNGDIGIDGMVINMAKMLAGAATNPFNNGYYQGDASAPLEAATACAGIYGPGAYPGFPGELLVQPISRSSYNAQGVNGRQFLLPALWNPATLTCTPPS